MVGHLFIACVHSDLCSGDEEYLPSPNPKAVLNQSVDILGCSPLKSVSQHDRISNGKRIVSRVYAVTTEIIAGALDISEITLKSLVRNAICCQKS